jgi:hypothetical protein
MFFRGLRASVKQLCGVLTKEDAVRKVLVARLMLSFLAVGLQAAPLLVESYQDGQINIPAAEGDTLTVTEVAFSVDTSCYVQFATGGILTLGKMWLELNGEKLPPLLFASRAYYFPNITYSYLLEPGEHTVSLIFASFPDNGYPATYEQAYLQALIFLPDETGAIAKRPIGDAEPTAAMTSVISRGPYVTVTGATELVDATGRVIENAIEDDRVSINALPQGIYFARDGDRTVVKIVKVD